MKILKLPERTFVPHVKERFKLSKRTEKILYSMKPNFGYNGFGEMLFYRTYSRQKSDGSQENWGDVIIRVTNGCLSIVKDFYIRNRIFWNENFWQDYGRKMAISAFKMHWLPSGRGLFSMGTEYVYQRGSMALFNCALTSLDDFANDVHWIMDALMNGVGVGFEVKEGGIDLYEPNLKETLKIIIDDSREGWCDSVKFLLESYLKPDMPKIIFDYSKIRLKGKPIKGYGGTASGPKPLEWLHEQIRHFCERRIEDFLYNSTMFKTDIVNCIGVCVVAGNVRRSAEMAFGDMSNSSFVNLKQYGMERYKYRKEHGWMSNNSVRLYNAEDFDMLGEIANLVIENGEPGYVNMINLKEGRMGKDDNLPPDEAIGLNPCLTGDTLILLADGRGKLSLKKLALENKDVPVFCLNDKGKPDIRMMRNIRRTGKKCKVYKIKLDDGSFIKATANHKFRLNDGEWKQVQDLKANDSLRILTRFEASMKAVIGGNGSSSIYRWINNGQRSNKAEHRMIAEFFYGKILYGFVVHHKDNNSLNNIKENLEILEKEKHDELHLDKMVWENNPMVRQYYEWSDEKKKEYRIKMSKSTSGLKNGNACKIGNEQIYNLCLEQTRLKNQKLTRSEWSAFAKKNNLPTSFKKFRRDYLGTINQMLKKCAIECEVGLGKARNHKVLFVEFCGYEDVFNGTVDDYHNFYVGGFESKTKSNRLKEVFVNVKNCGEVPLQNKEVCDLSETFPTVCESEDEWFEACEFAAFYCFSIYLTNTHRSETNYVVRKNRRIGVGLVDFTGWKMENGTYKVTRWMREGYRRIKKCVGFWADQWGVPKPIRYTTVKPGGTVPKLAGKTSGIGYPNFIYQIRRVMVQEDKPIVEVLKRANIPFEKAKMSMNTLVFEFPIKTGPAKEVKEVSLWEQAMNLVLMQREWADNAVSNTLFFRPKWQLYRFYKKEEKMDFRYDDLHGFKLEHTEEGIKVWKFDPSHEEDDIESVLSAIAPLTKSVSLMPHTSSGVYAQMPEEGITKDEYEKRLKSIKEINWNDFRNSDGEDEKFCTKESCVLVRD